MRLKTFGIIALIFTSSTLAWTGEIKSLHRDIILLNLINGLYLNQDQTRTLFQYVQKADILRKKRNQRMNEQEERLKSVLTAVKASLLEGNELAGEMKRNVHQVEKTIHEIDDETDRALLNLEKQVEALLTPNQRLVLQDYKPCIIPPKSGRIGQPAEAMADGLIRNLNHIRRLSAEAWRQKRESMTDRYIAKIERHEGVLDEAKKEARVQSFHGAADGVRILSDQDFMLQKAEIARSLLPEEGTPPGRVKNQLSKTGRLLLDTQLLPILQDRL